jgi:hypothetical protein
MSKFDNISDAEYKQLKEAFGIIAALVGGADGTVDEDEQQWAEKVIKIRTFSGNEDLFPFYDEVKAEVGDDLKILIPTLSGSLETIQSALSDRLTRLNPILAKLPPHTGHLLYKGYVSYAEHIAKASGGIFRFFAVSSAEKKWIGLSMLHPIAEPEETFGEEE